MKNHWLHKRRWTVRFSRHLAINCLDYRDEMKGWAESVWKDSFRNNALVEGSRLLTERDNNWIDGWAALATILCTAWVIAHNKGYVVTTFRKDALLGALPACVKLFKPTNLDSFTQGYEIAVDQFLIEQNGGSNA